jgi:hypothetical protein
MSRRDSRRTATCEIGVCVHPSRRRLRRAPQDEVRVVTGREAETNRFTISDPEGRCSDYVDACRWAGRRGFQPTMAWGTKRDEFLVIGPQSSRTDSPAGMPAGNQEPRTA